MEQQAPFRFLDLPKELRLMVYEYIPITNVHYTLAEGGSLKLPFLLSRPGWCTQVSTRPPHPCASITFVFQTVSSSLLATCRLVYVEAHDIIMKEMTLVMQSPKIITCTGYLLYMAKPGGLLEIITLWRDSIASGTHQGIRSFMTNGSYRNSRYIPPLITDSSLFEHPGYEIVEHFIDMSARKLRSEPGAALEISLVARNGQDELLALPIVNIYRPIVMEGFTDIKIKIGIAGPQFFKSLADQRKWESMLTRWWLSENSRCRILPPGSCHPDRFTRAEALVGAVLDKWNAGWESGN